MKGVSKWFIAFLTLFGLAVPSFLTYSDVNALKYSFNTFPLYQTRYPEYSSFSGQTMGFWFDTTTSTDLASSRINILSANYFKRSGTYPSCEESSSPSRIFASTATEVYNYKSIWSGEGTGFYRSFGVDTCQYDIKRYDYDSFVGNAYKLSNGEVETLVNVDEALFSNTAGQTRTLKRVTIPLNFSDEYSFPANTPMTFQFGLVKSYPNNFSNYTSPNVDFQVQYASNGTYYTESITTCSVNDNYEFLTTGTDQSTPETTGHFIGFQVSCSWTPTVDVSHFTSRLIIYGSGQSYNPAPFLTYTSNAGLYFSASYLTTNNDDTWSGINISPALTGENVSMAPGYTQIYGYPPSSGCSPGDFLCDLSNLFSFNFINPFTPIFGLFANNEACTQIPTIAGMIHSDEQTVCPWFDSSTRNIVTPVLGIASMMLLFGFAVRWLGARSGNFFEDSTEGNDVGSIHIGRRNKK